MDGRCDQRQVWIRELTALGAQAPLVGSNEQELSHSPVWPQAGMESPRHPSVTMQPPELAVQEPAVV